MCWQTICMVRPKLNALETIQGKIALNKGYSHQSDWDALSKIPIILKPSYRLTKRGEMLLNLI